MDVMQTGVRARDLSFAHCAQTWAGQGMIRLLESATGRGALLKRARGFETDLAAGRCVFDVMAARYGISLDIAGGTLADVPSDGPLIMIANHPYGILDGLMMGHLMSRRRSDFRILANSVFANAPGAGRFVLPINFDGTKAAIAENVVTRGRARDLLEQGGAIGIFPGGTVSTGARPFARPMDPQWRGFTARMIARTGAAVVPVYFDGHTSRAFQIASHLHQTLRMGLMIREFRSRVDRPVRVVIGRPLDPAGLAARVGDTKRMMDFLRKATYELAPEPLDSFEQGYEFEDRRQSR